MAAKRALGLGTFLLLLAIVSACSPNPQPVGLTPIPSLAPAATLTLVPAIQGAPAEATPGGPGQAALGAPLYELRCSACHGPQGEGVVGPALRNNALIGTGEDQGAYTTIANGRAGTEMPAWLQSKGGPLTAGEIQNVVAFLHTLQGVEALPSATPQAAEATEAPLPAGAPTEEPARPSLAGGAGGAVSLVGDAGRGEGYFGEYCAVCHGPEGVAGVPNPDSDDGVVPELNPIDPTLVSSDAKEFATNVDLFLEHGSVPAGPAPEIMMPSFGDSKMLDAQTIADIIAYVMALNGVGAK
jgi:mono/diheme cytochrome c family protein